MIGIFKILKIGRQIKRGTFDPHAFAGEEVGDLATGVLGLPIFLFGGLSLLGMIIGFTNFWFGPETFIGIIGIILLIPFFTLIKIKNKIIHAIEEHLKEHPHNTQKLPE